MTCSSLRRNTELCQHEIECWLGSHLSEEAERSRSRATGPFSCHRFAQFGFLKLEIVRRAVKDLIIRPYTTATQCSCPRAFIDLRIQTIGESQPAGKDVFNSVAQTPVPRKWQWPGCRKKPPPCRQRGVEKLPGESRPKTSSPSDES